MPEALLQLAPLVGLEDTLKVRLMRSVRVLCLWRGQWGSLAMVEQYTRRMEWTQYAKINPL